MTDCNIVRFEWVYALLFVTAIAHGTGRPVAAQPGDATAAQAGDSAVAAPQQESKASAQPKPEEIPQSARAQTQASIPSLQEMLDVALEHNPDVRAAEAHLKVAEAELDRTRLDLVQKIVAFRARWQGQRSATRAAEDKVAHLRRMAEKGFVTPQQLEAEQGKLAAEREKLSELPAHLAFLLGRPLPGADANASPKDLPKRTELLRNTLRPLLKRLIETGIAQYNVGRGSLEQICDSSRRLMEVEKSLAATEAERIAAIETHRDRMQQLHKEAKARFEVGREGPRDVLMTEVYSAEAELELLEERGE